MNVLNACHAMPTVPAALPPTRHSTLPSPPPAASVSPPHDSRPPSPSPTPSFLAPPPVLPPSVAVPVRLPLPVLQQPGDVKGSKVNNYICDIY